MKFFESVGNLKALRGVLDWHTISRSTRGLPTKLVDELEAYKILVLATHPGEEVLGCGGVIAKHLRNREKVFVLTLCDGSRGTKSGIRDRLLGVKRVRESKLASHILGLDPDNLFWWRYQDGKLLPSRTTTEALRVIFGKVNPELIYLPHFLSKDLDHRAANAIFLEAATELSRSTHVAAYELFDPIIINRLVPIGEVYSKKLSALKEHHSQEAVRDWVKIANGLNNYRGASAGLEEPAEGFFVANLELYQKLFGLLQ